MSDAIQSTVPVTPPAAEPVAPAAPATPEPPVDYSTHPVWGNALAPIPDLLRGPIVETIRESERQAQTAIEAARANSTPAEWRQLIEEAKTAGVTPEQLVESYEGQRAMGELLHSDPDAFLSEIQGQVDAMVQAGQITRRQGQAAMQQAQQVAADAQPILSDSDQRLADMQAKLDRIEQERAAEQERQRAALEQQQHDAQLEQEANEFFDTFDAEMLSLGYVERTSTGQIAAVIPAPTLQLIGEVAAQHLDRNPQLSKQQAIKAAAESVRQQIEASGGHLGRPAAAPGIPVMGASSQIPSANAGQPQQKRSMDDRASHALAELLRQTGAQ